MLFRLISAFVALTTSAAFLGWVKSNSADAHDSKRIDEIFSVQSVSSSAGKKSRSSRLQVADTSR